MTEVKLTHQSGDILYIKDYLIFLFNILKRSFLPGLIFFVLLNTGFDVFSFSFPLIFIFYSFIGIRYLIFLFITLVLGDESEKIAYLMLTALVGLTGFVFSLAFQSYIWSTIWFITITYYWGWLLDFTPNNI